MDGEGGRVGELQQFGVRDYVSGTGGRRQNKVQAALMELYRRGGDARGSGRVPGRGVPRGRRDVFGQGAGVLFCTLCATCCSSSISSSVQRAPSMRWVDGPAREGQLARQL